MEERWGGVSERGNLDTKGTLRVKHVKLGEDTYQRAISAASPARSRACAARSITYPGSHLSDIILQVFHSTRIRKYRSHRRIFPLWRRLSAILILAVGASRSRGRSRLRDSEKHAPQLFLRGKEPWIMREPVMTPAGGA